MSGESNSRASKHKNGMESSSAAKPESKRNSKKNESEQKVDKYCWLCHTETNDKTCVSCHRAYHDSCLDEASASFTEFGVCPECQLKSVRCNRFKNPKRMLDNLTRQSFKKNLKVYTELFFCWPKEDTDNLYKIIDGEILLDNIYHFPYKTTAQFYGDVKFIYHNSCIMYGANSDQAKAAENFIKDVEKELTELEACPVCYYYVSCDEDDQDTSFVRLCNPPHDIVWAQVTGHPYWPAKCLKVVKDIAQVKFFGQHERSNIPVAKCFYLSESHPNDKSSKISSGRNPGLKSASYESAIMELLSYIELYTEKFGHFSYYPHKTPYKPCERQNEGNLIHENSAANDIPALNAPSTNGTTICTSALVEAYRNIFFDDDVVCVAEQRNVEG